MLKAHLLVIDPQNDFADILAGPLIRSDLPPLTARDFDLHCRCLARSRIWSASPSSSNAPGDVSTEST
jgi:hypothetical protein